MNFDKLEDLSKKRSQIENYIKTLENDYSKSVF